MRKRSKIAVGVVLLLGMGALDAVLYPRFQTSAPKLNLAQNASWLHFDWARGKSRESTFHLAARLQKDGFKDAYFHVRYIGKSGRLRFRDAPAARRLNAQMKQAAPSIRRLAWLYIGNERGITGVDISDPEIRRRIVAETQFLTRECGFDGVQIDYEICSDGDAAFLQLLREIRAATTQKFLSVATPMWLPWPLGAYGWSEAYFGQVAKNCDQIAVMAYDSALYSPRHYVWLIRQQAAKVPRAVKTTNPRCEVLLGVPSYEDGGASHWNYAENLAMALRGAREAQNSRGAASLDGVALFADYSTDALEWNVWRRSFSRPGK
ncbi:MAG: hypothetical protein KY445_03455 [Armatimonadetes bacterium]|nr:hypothetical protein [Armatimonadota bacterium]